MPDNAASIDMNVIIAGDYAGRMDQAGVKMVGAWARFKLKSGGYSCQLLLGRSLLAGDGTVPKNELEALTMASNMGWILRQTLEKWGSSYIIIGDSTISLCWVMSEKKRLSLFHRNRCAQIRRGSELSMLYHVMTEHNPADLGTRPEKVDDSDLGPNGKWEKGLPWMKEEIEHAVDKGILTPAANLRMTEEEEEDFRKGLIFEKSPEILTRGHCVMLNRERINKVKGRAELSRYPLSPTKFKFEKVVRTYAIIRKFLRSFKCVRDKLQKIGENKFQMLTTKVTLDIEEDIDRLVDNDRRYKKEFVGLSFGVKKPGTQFKGKYHVQLSKEDVSWALQYLFTKGTNEVKMFNEKEFIDKIAIEKNQILFSKSRLLDGQRFKVAGGLENMDILDEFGICVWTPVLDRFSPVSYSILEYVHRKISKHGGYETCLRESLNFCFIIQGMSLCREIGESCVTCAKRRKKYLDVAMGPISDEQLTIAPPFWVTMCDIYGPCYVYVPGHSMFTRNKKVIDVKCYVLVFACPTTKMVNLQVIESKSVDGIVEGIIRLCCEQGGVPNFMLIDQESSLMKVLKEAEVNIRDLEHVLHKEKGINFRTCPVSGHNYSGLVERKIRTIQECLDKNEIGNQRLHATGLQTYCKLVENHLNSLPIGYSYGRDSDNSPLLKLIFPNMLKGGRLISRTLDGPIRMPQGPGELMEKVEKVYSTFFKLWNITMIPKLMKAHKWYDSKTQLVVGDIVYFQKTESDLSSKWTVGIISDVVKSKDDLIRRVTVRYQNASENTPRFTDRAAKSLINYSILMIKTGKMTWPRSRDW